MKRSTLLAVAVTVFVDLLGFGIVVPLLPYYAQRFGAGGGWIGLLVTAYSAAQFVAAPLLGAISDRIGRRRVLLISLAGSTVSLGLTGLAHGLVPLLAARLAAGAFAGSVAVGQAYAVDLANQGSRDEAEARRRRTHALGVVGAAIGLGFTLGPALGAGLARFSFGAAVFAAAGLAAANLVVAACTLPEPEAPAGRASTGNPLSGVVAALRNGPARPVLAATFLTVCAFTAMETTFPLLGQRRLGLDARSLGITFAGVGVVMVLVQGAAARSLGSRWSERAIAGAGAAAMLVAMPALALAPPATVYIALAVLAAGQGVLTTFLPILLARVAGTGTGALLGAGRSASAAARGIAPVCAGALFDRGAALPYLLGGGLALLAIAGLARVSRPATESASAQRTSISV